MTPLSRSFGEWFWDSLEFIGSLASALAVVVLTFGFVMWVLS